jgi:predicted nuclease with TOPRIM domain
LEEEVKSLPHTGLSTKVNQLTKTNAQLTREVSHLQASVDEVHEEVGLLQVDKNQLFDKYQALKKDYDSILL